MIEFTVKVLLKKTDLIAFNRESMFKFKPFYTQIMFWVFSAVISFTIIQIIAGLIKHDKLITQLPFFLLIGFIIFILVKMRNKIDKAASKFYDSDVKLQHEMTYLFNENEVKIHGSNFEATYSWKEIHKVIRSKKFLLIYNTSATALMIPLNILTMQEAASIEHCFNNSIPFSADAYASH